jgi:hypothetical protein
MYSLKKVIAINAVEITRWHATVFETDVVRRRGTDRFDPVFRSVPCRRERCDHRALLVFLKGNRDGVYLFSQR